MEMKDLVAKKEEKNQKDRNFNFQNLNTPLLTDFITYVLNANLAAPKTIRVNKNMHSQNLLIERTNRVVL